MRQASLPNTKALRHFRAIFAPAAILGESQTISG